MLSDDSTDVLIDVHGSSEKGSLTLENDDHFLIARLRKSMLVEQSSIPTEEQAEFSHSIDGRLFLVADGVGGVPGAERASAMTVEEIAGYIIETMPWFFRLGKEGFRDIREELLNAVGRSELALRASARGKDPGTAPASALTFGFFLWPMLHVVHVGHSRLYLQRGEEFVRLTRDHTIANRLVESGALTKEEAEHSPFTHTVFNVVGGEETGLSLDLVTATLEANDRLLFCTDGLSDALSDDRIAQILEQPQAAESLCEDLISNAKESDGRDNIAAIVVKVGGKQQLARPKDGKVVAMAA